MTRRTSWVLQACVAAGLWIGAYELNSWAFAAFEWTQMISLIFLPAAVRLLAVLIWGWRGALGLWLGTMVTNVRVFGGLSKRSLVVATLSATAPFLAAALTRRLLGLAATLQGLTATSLMVLALSAAAFNVVLHTTYFWLIGILQDVPDGLLFMFAGDVLGTLIVFYVIKALLTLSDRLSRD